MQVMYLNFQENLHCGVYVPLSVDELRFVQKVHLVRAVTVCADVIVTHCCYVTTYRSCILYAII